MDNRVLFKQYLQDTSKVSETTIKRYIHAIDIISHDVTNATKTEVNIYSLNKIIEIQNIIKLYNSILVLKNKNDKGQRFYTSALKKYKSFLIVDRISIFLKWNDRNGIYTHRDRFKQEFNLLSYEEAAILFYGVLNDDLYYSLTDNIFELNYNEVINIAKENNIYEKTENALGILTNSSEINDEFFYKLI